VNSASLKSGFLLANLEDPERGVLKLSVGGTLDINLVSTLDGFLDKFM
jgi:hypothetical protein